MDKFRGSPLALGIGLWLLVLASPARSSTPLSCGSLVSGTISAAGQVDQYTYAAEAGQIVTLTLAGFNSGYPYYNAATATLYNPSGSAQKTFGANNQEQISLASTGTYLIQVYASDYSSTGNYSLGLDCRKPIQPSMPLSCGELPNGNIAASAQVDQYTYSGTAGELVTLTLAGFNSGYPYYNAATATLYDPSGAAVSTFGANSQEQLTLTLTGTYLIQVYASDYASTGTYSLGMECRNPVRPAQALSCGALVDGEISGAAQVDQYAYSGQAGGILTLTLSGFNSGYPYYNAATVTLYDPSGAAVLTFSANGQQQVTLSWTGTYVIQVYASDLASTGTYSLGLDCILGLNGEGFVPITPCRVADTRGYGFSGAFGPPSIGGGSTRSFPIPSSSCGIPANAQAYSLNLTAVPPGPLGYLTAWPTGELQPLASNLNSSNGQVVAGAAIIPAGSNGAVSVYVSNETDLVIDINGYFVPEAPSNDAFYTLAPCRVADTRGYGFTGPFGPPEMGAASTRSFPILSSPCIPASADTDSKAYSFNVTVVPPGPLTYLSLWPAGDPQPYVSTLNSYNGRVVANAALVPAGTPNGGIDVYVSDESNVIMDVNGYFGPPAASGALYLFPVSPCRIADTRTNFGFTGAFGPPSLTGGSTRTFPIPSSFCGIPSTAQAYALNVTVVPTGYLGYLTTWPTGSSQPVVSTLNSFDGSIVANLALVPAGTNGSINVYVSDTTDVIIDITGYFAAP